MAYGNFKPIIWSKYIEHELKKQTVFKEDCDYRFEGEAGKGKTVKILGVGKPTIGDYKGADIGAPETVPDGSVTLMIDKAKYFNFQVDDVDICKKHDNGRYIRVSCTYKKEDKEDDKSINSNDD